MREDVGSSDAAEGFGSLVTDNGGLVLVVESLEEHRDGVEGQELAKDESDLVPTNR